MIGVGVFSTIIRGVGVGVLVGLDETDVARFAGFVGMAVGEAGRCVGAAVGGLVGSAAGGGSAALVLADGDPALPATSDCGGRAGWPPAASTLAAPTILGSRGANRLPRGSAE